VRLSRPLKLPSWGWTYQICPSLGVKNHATWTYQAIFWPSSNPKDVCKYLRKKKKAVCQFVLWADVGAEHDLSLEQPSVEREGSHASFVSASIHVTWLCIPPPARPIILPTSSSLHQVTQKCLQISFRILRISKTSHQLRTGARFQQEWQKVPTFLSSAQVATCNPLTPPSFISSEY
jgi:hypothetical protein